MLVSHSFGVIYATAYLQLVLALGVVMNRISASHQAYLDAGGLGILIGDGALNYRRERVLEAYYAYALTKGITA